MTVLDTTAAQPAGGPPVAGEPCVLIKLGEVVLKGRNRELFERRLQNNVRSAVRDIAPVEIWRRHGVMVVRIRPTEDTGDTERDARADVATVDALARRISDVMGIVWVHRAWRVAKDPDSVVRAALDLMAGRTGAFAVRSRRRDKRFPLTSTELDRLVGAKIVEAYQLPVRLKDPEHTLSVEVDRDEVFVFTGGLPGQGGLPVGMSGRALVLMSGGIDSPVAAYRMMRRGLRVDYLHFSGMPFTGPESIYKAYALVRELDRFQGGSRLFVVPFGKAQQQIKSSGADRLAVIAQRRLMLRTAQTLAHRLGGAALITGDSLGQVSSQTLANMTALDDAVDLPILRPLVGMDKVEIMDTARRINTLAISELPDEDCCTLLAPRRAETRAKIEDLRQIDKRLDADELAERLADSITEHRPAYGEGGS
ncbi:thiamine biosynthesis protein ThiI [Thermomonospora echinospora]|uniref:Probable tRNA sulfurtransferase n=1 Tax=Thermomonospora echinospora TaxID=1992 RepID=A0A1H5SA26_9ACTN|nr:tRNA uracil 4-sulfurtransferase ThiI [Thermomonospora echinospora]SEF47260.1 thiamine biosynthesis protein ThiI [Thermomonospora echinospora]